MTKALIFDFDGLIMDTESPEVEAWQAIYAEHGQEFPLQIWIRDVVGSSAANFDPAAHLAGLTGGNLDQAALRERARTFRLDRQSRLPARPGVQAYLQDARRLGLKLAVASSSRHAWVDGYLRQLGLFEAFDAVICREEVQNIKPNPELFLRALAVLGLRADEALAFEDSPNGILAARRAGLRVVAVPNPVTAQSALAGADVCLDSLADLPLEQLLERFDPAIRPEAPEDILEIHRIEEAAFGRPAEAGLVDLCRQRGRISLSLVAERKHRLVGHILFTPVTLDPPCPGWHGLGLGPVAVLPEFQRAGIGSRLIERGLEVCQANGVDFVVLLGDPGYYSRFGFIPASEFGLGNEYGAGEKFMLRELRPGVLKGAQGLVKYVPEFQESGC